MKKHKIVYIAGGNYAANGMSRVLSTKINYLAEYTDYEVYMVLTERPDLPLYYPISNKVKQINFNINFDELDTLPLHKKIIKYITKQRTYKKLLSEYLIKTKPDITVSILRREINFINGIADGSKKIGEIHFNKSSYRIFQKSYLPQWINRKISEKWQKELVREVNRLNKFIVLSEEDKEAWKGIKNISVIYNPLADFPNTVSDCSSKKAIATGRYTWQKGFDMLIDAWKIVNDNHPDWHLDIYGNGEHQKYQRMAADKGLGNAITCHPSTSSIYERFQESSIFVLSSRYEGFGMVIAEAMSCGVPAVSFACPCGPKDIITEGENGLLAEKENVTQLAEKICYLIENDKERKEMGKKARESSKRFTQDAIMKQWMELFDSLTK